MRIAFVTSALTPAVGGPFQSVGGLARSLARLPDTHVSVVGVVPGGTAWRDHADHWDGCTLTVCEGTPCARLRAAFRTPQMRGEGAADVLHFGELWNPVAVLEAIVGRCSDRVIVHSPRGMLEPWALRHHALRKRLAWWAGQRRALGRTDLLHATSSTEAGSIRDMGLRQPVALIPNAVAIHAPPGRPRTPTAGRTALALGRLHPKKGFEALIRAWGRVAPAGWRLLIAGPDEGGHASVLRRLVAETGCETIDVAGPVYGGERSALLDRAHLFICSSYSENFGMVVAEAMERGLAVITTTGTPWRRIAADGMGWLTEPGVAGLATALAEALALPQRELDERGAAGREHVERHLDWPSAARAMRAAYAWTLGGGALPECILLPTAGKSHP